MPCIEPTEVYTPARDTLADGLVRLAMGFLSKIADGHHHAGHYPVPRKKPVAVIEVTHEKRLKSAFEAWGPATIAIGKYVADANEKFHKVHRVLQQAKDQVGADKKFDSEYEAAVKGGYAVECDEVDCYWRCLSDTMNAVHREQVRMLCAIEKMRSSYILRQVCPEDPCDDCGRQEWASHCAHVHPTPTCYPTNSYAVGLREKAAVSELALAKADREIRETRNEAEKAREELAQCQNRVTQAEKEIAEAKRALEACEKKHEEAEKRWRDERGDDLSAAPGQETAQSAQEQSAASSAAGEKPRR
jgi:DNA gyrase/topoisomerase IV subunit A